MSDEEIKSIQKELVVQSEVLPRAQIVKESLSKSFILKVSSIDEAFNFSNDYAPEHLILHIKDAENKLSKVMNAGSVFVGPYSPERYMAIY